MVTMNIAIIVALLTTVTLYGEVTPPNYFFTLEQLKPFHPGQELAAAKKRYPQNSLLRESGEISLHQFDLSYQRYKFPVMVQSFGGKVLDMFARLPSYFLHNLFHQSLIDIYGKQERYFKQERSAIYIWNNEKGNRHIYSGSCSITCFPDYYSVSPVTPPAAVGPSFIPIIDQIKLNPSGIPKKGQ
jgi:hypothetical protein